MGDLGKRKVGDNEEFNVNEAQKIDCFNRGKLAFLRYFFKEMEGNKVEVKGIIRFFNDWAYDKRLGELEKRWIRMEVRDAFLKRHKAIYLKYAEDLKVRPTRFDKARLRNV